jgi:hypothetical protein
VPGAGAAAIIAIASGLLGGYWAWPKPSAPSSGAASRIEEVSQGDLDGALGTIAVPPEQVERFRERDACGRKLAWVTVVRAPGVSAPGRIRLQSGRYVTPAFDLTDVPVRVAIPYPAPYPSGHGTIMVVGATIDATVALSPPWHVQAQAGPQPRQVTWKPSGDCPAAR